MKHVSNTQESVKLLDEIIIPYVEKEKDMLNLDEKQPAFSIINVFSGQITKTVIDKMAENYIKTVKVPANMTWNFQLLDITVNGSTKAFLKKHLTELYSCCIAQELVNGKDVDSINIQLKMSILKPLHAQWIIDSYNYFTSSERREITSNGWKAAFIEEALIKGTKGLDLLDHFASIDPLSEEVDSIDFAVTLNTTSILFLYPRRMMMMIWKMMMMIHGLTKMKNP